MKKVFLSSSSSETKRIGEKIGKTLLAGDVVALKGGLGAGKTTLVKGIAKALDVPEKKVSSPTFVLMHEYKGRKKIYHMDWYRLGEVSGFDAAMAEECFADQAIALIEWAERGADIFPTEHIEISLKHASGDKRRITVSTRGERYKDWFKKLNLGGKG